MSRASTHTCHANNCETKVPPAMFMCRKHWFKLTTALRHELLDAYEPGQENRMDPSDEYIEVAQRCVAYVAEKEAG